jgi:hypothetical protein
MSEPRAPVAPEPSGPHPLAWAAAIAAVLSALSTLGASGAPRAVQPRSLASAGPGDGALVAHCEGRSLREDESCLPLPGADRAVLESDPAAAKRDTTMLPRRPERPAAFGAYRYPAGRAGVPSLVSPVSSAVELELSPAELGKVAREPLALALRVVAGEPVRALRLEGQEGEADVVFVGTLRGATVVTRHLVRESSGTRSYLVLVEHLSSVAEELRAGDLVDEGHELGLPSHVGKSGLVVLEVRMVRPGTPLDRELPLTTPSRLESESQSIRTDARNVLPLLSP